MTTPNRPLSAREFFSLPTSGVPFIPELHTDDCDDVDCTRCVDQPRIAALDVPLQVVESQARTLAGCLAEQQHLLDPADRAFAAMACRSDCCSAESGDPVWDAWLAARITETRAAWTAAHTKAGGQA